MRRSLLAIAMLAVLGASTSRGLAEDKTVTMTFRGLFAFDTRTGQVVFLSAGDTHPPRLTIHQKHLDPQPALAPELVIPNSDGSGTSVWKFYRIRMTDNVEKKGLDFEHETNNGLPNGTPNPVKESAGYWDKRLAWIPRMTTVVPSSDLDPDEVTDAESAGTFPHGRLDRIFDTSAARNQCFTIGSRVMTAVADAIQLKVTLKDPIAPLLEVQGVKNGPWVPFVIRGASQVDLHALPLTPGDDLGHFCHYFTLLEGDPPCEKPLKCKSCSMCDPVDGNQPPAGAPGTKPIRCAPVQFP